MAKIPSDKELLPAASHLHHLHPTAAAGWDDLGAEAPPQKTPTIFLGPTLATGHIQIDL